MIKLFEAAFYPPSRTSEEVGSTAFAVLPQNTSEELTLSEFHSKLDRALTFLQRDVGYALLDDARPHPGGGVRLRAPERNILAVPRGDRSAKLPQEQTTLRASLAQSDSPGSTCLSEEAVESMKLVRQVWQASSSSVPRALRNPLEEDLPTIGPEVAKYAHYECDLVLVSRFAHVLCKTITQDLKAQDGFSPEKVIKHDGLYKCVLQGVRLLHQCGYDYADVILVLAYASVYFRGAFASIGKKMSPNEAAHVVVLLIYLAHAFLLDETCPLRIWQKHIFRKYCTLKVLDSALFRLFQMRPDFKLKITYEEERTALLGLSGMQYQGVQASITGEADAEVNPTAGLNSVNLTQPKINEKRVHLRAYNGNGCEREIPSSSSSRPTDGGKHVVGSGSAANISLPASHSGRGSASNARTHASTNVEAIAVPPITADYWSQAHARSANSANRVGETTHLLVS